MDKSTKGALKHKLQCKVLYLGKQEETRKVLVHEKKAHDFSIKTL